MKRVSLTDGSGGWFDADAATMWEEDTRWDGSNRISIATGSQWDHEALYRTRGGKWVRNWWSQWQGSGETYEQISARDAAAWLVVSGHDLPPELSEHVAASEI